MSPCWRPGNPCESLTPGHSACAVYSAHLLTQTWRHPAASADGLPQSTARYFQGDHTHITVQTVCYNCSIWLLVIIVDLLLCLIDKLNIIIGMYVWGKKHSIYRVQFAVSGMHWGSWNGSPVDKGKLLHKHSWAGFVSSRSIPRRIVTESSSCSFTRCPWLSPYPSWRPLGRQRMCLVLLCLQDLRIRGPQ